jgi:hypothetical protein
MKISLSKIYITQKIISLRVHGVVTKRARLAPLSVLAPNTYYLKACKWTPIT